jgi:hypothetical protein
MGIADFVYRLKPQAGDTAPHNEVGGGHPFSGGTATLVDTGGGNYAWRFSGGAAIADIPARSWQSEVAGSGITLAIRMRVSTQPAAAFVPFITYGLDATPTNGLYLGMDGTSNGLRTRYSTDSNIPIGSTAVERVFVLRLTPGIGGTLDKHELWLNTVGRSGTAPNSTASGNYTSRNLSKLIINAINSAVIDARDIVVWHEELPDADCAAVADNFDAQFTGGGTTVTCTTGDAAATGATAAIYQGATIGCSAGDAAATGSTATISNSNDVTINCNVGNASATGATATISINVTIACAVGNAVATGSTAGITNSTAFVTEPLINNTGSILANQAVVWTWFPGGRIGAMDLVTAVDGTGTTASDGTLTVTGLSSGAGILMVAIQNTSAVDDAVYYEAGTVA